MKRTLLLAALLSLTALCSQAQIDKELHRENDGYSWYEYTYEKNSNGHYPHAAFDIYGNRITPTGEYLIRYSKGFFVVWTRKDSNDQHVYELYDKKGKCIVPDRGYNSIGVYGNFIKAEIQDKNYNVLKCAMYDKQGNCIIPESLGYTWIAYYEDYGVFWCEKKGQNLEVNHTFSRDGKTYAEGYLDGNKFRAASKKTVNVSTSNDIAKETTSNKTTSTTTTATQATPQPKTKVKIYTAEELEELSLFPVYDNNNLYGYITLAGDLVIDYQYKHANYFGDGLAAVQNSSGKWGFIDKTGKTILDFQWKGALKFAQGLCAVMNDDNKVGFIDKKGKTVLPFKWTNTHSFSEGLCAVADENNFWGFINKSGQTVIPCKWSGAEPFSESRARVKNNANKWGYIEKTGNLVIPCEYVDGKEFSEGLAAVKKEDPNAFLKDQYVWGFIDKSGKTVRAFAFKDASSFLNGCAYVKYLGSDKWEAILNLPMEEAWGESSYDNETGMYGFTDEAGVWQIPAKWKYAFFFNEGLACVQGDNDLYGYINNKGKLVIPCSWRHSRVFSEGLAYVMNAKEKCGFINKSGVLVVPCKWDNAGEFKEGLAAVMDANGKWGFINKKGVLVIPCKWSNFMSPQFSEGLASVENEEGKVGFIDKTGKLVIPCQWKTAYDFGTRHDNLSEEECKESALVITFDGYRKTINKKGEYDGKVNEKVK